MRLADEVEGLRMMDKRLDGEGTTWCLPVTAICQSIELRPFSFR